MVAQRRFPVILRSRKPVSDEVVYASSIPYRPLTEWKADGGWHVRKDRLGYALRDPDGGWRSFPRLRKAGEYVGLWRDPNRRGRRR